MWALEILLDWIYEKIENSLIAVMLTSGTDINRTYLNISDMNILAKIF